MLAFLGAFFLLCSFYAPGYLRLRPQRDNRIFCSALLAFLAGLALLPGALLTALALTALALLALALSAALASLTALPLLIALIALFLIWVRLHGCV